jgi:hypothetical protein
VMQAGESDSHGHIEPYIFKHGLRPGGGAIRICRGRDRNGLEQSFAQRLTLRIHRRNSQSFSRQHKRAHAPAADVDYWGDMMILLFA